MSDPIFHDPFDFAVSRCNQSKLLKACQETLGSFVQKEIVGTVVEPTRGVLYIAFFGVARKDTTDL